MVSNFGVVQLTPEVPLLRGNSLIMILLLRSPLKVSATRWPSGLRRNVKAVVFGRRFESCTCHYYVRLVPNLHRICFTTENTGPVDPSNAQQYYIYSSGISPLLHLFFVMRRQAASRQQQDKIYIVPFILEFSPLSPQQTHFPPYVFHDKQFVLFCHYDKQFVSLSPPVTQILSLLSPWQKHATVGG